MKEEEKTLDKLSHGDKAAFAQVYDRYRSAIYGASRKVLRSDTLAVGIVEEVFSEVWHNREGLPRQDFKRYLLRVARDHIFDRFKKQIQEGVPKENNC